MNSPWFALAVFAPVFPTFKNGLNGVKISKVPLTKTARKTARVNVALKCK